MSFNFNRSKYCYPRNVHIKKVSVFSVIIVRWEDGVKQTFSLQPQKFYIWEECCSVKTQKIRNFPFLRQLYFFLHERHFIVDKTGLIGLNIIIDN